MAIYVTSDLHGLPILEFKKLLNLADFKQNDWLYILGDVIDKRNDGGIEILLWLLEQPNAQLILGNHEAMLLSCSFIFDEITDDNIEAFTKEKMELLMNYSKNGGDITLRALRELMHSSPDTVGDILEYLREAPLYETVYAGGKDFLLVHSGIDNFDKNKRLSEYNADDFIWASPDIEKEFYDDVITVFGHTPTMKYGNEYNGKFLKTKSWINIDLGLLQDNKPGLLRLDDLQEIYL